MDLQGRGVAMAHSSVFLLPLSVSDPRVWPLIVTKENGICFGSWFRDWQIWVFPFPLLGLEEEQGVRRDDGEGRETLRPECIGGFPVS